MKKISISLKLEELVEDYQKTRNDEIILEIYKKLSGLSYQISSNYWGLTSDDISSYSLETIYNCLKSFRLNGGSKFSSYYATSLKFNLRAETTALNQQKRKANLPENSSSYEELSENGFAFSYTPENDIIFLESLRSIDNLTDNEKRYCEYILDGALTNAEIAKKMKVSIMTLSNMRKSMREKLREVFIN